MEKLRPYRYTEARNLWNAILGDMRILAGEETADCEVTWQDVAGTLSVNLKVLAVRIDAARAGNVVDGPVVFPPSEGEDCNHDADTVETRDGYCLSCNGKVLR